MDFLMLYDINDIRHITEHQADGSKIEQEHDGMGKTAVVCSQCTLQHTVCQSGYVTSRFRVRQHVVYKNGWTAEREVWTRGRWNSDAVGRSNEPWVNREDTQPNAGRTIKLKDTHFDIITEDTGQLQYGGQQENCYGVRHTSKVTYFLFGTLIFSC